jgi:predicted tellurium resistance membrane protein TerC
MRIPRLAATRSGSAPLAGRGETLSDPRRSAKSEFIREPFLKSMHELLSFNSLAAVATLSLLEVVLGIDNIVFLAILTGKLPQEQQPRARKIGLGLAAIGRCALLLAITWVITLDKTVLFEIPFDFPGGQRTVEHEPSGETYPVTPVSVKDLVLLLGGLFLLAKATWEIGHQMNEARGSDGPKPAHSMAAVLAQIVAIDLVFSIDSVLTAVGMVHPGDYEQEWVPLTIMISAVLIAIGVMLIFSGPIAGFVNNHPSVRMLALAFLILIGVVLLAEGLHTHVPRGYIYFAMAFSLGVEMLNIRAESRRAAAEEK